MANSMIRELLEQYLMCIHMYAIMPNSGYEH